MNKILLCTILLFGAQQALGMEDFVPFKREGDAYGTPPSDVPTRAMSSELDSPTVRGDKYLIAFTYPLENQKVYVVGKKSGMPFLIIDHAEKVQEVKFIPDSFLVVTATDNDATITSSLTGLTDKRLKPNEPWQFKNYNISWNPEKGISITEVGTLTKSAEKK